MSKQKQTFTDPKTGEEIESTWLARLIGRLGFGLFFALGSMLVIRPGCVPSGVTKIGWDDVLIFGLMVGLFFILISGLDHVRNNLLSQRIHDGVALRQHFRRQRILRRQEYPHVPDEALSRAEQPREPEPTDASLSQTEVEEEKKSRLTEAVEEEARPGLWQSIKARLRR